MPLKKGSSKKVISKNIGELVNAYKKTGKIGNTKPKSKKKAAQIASAIAYSKAKNEAFEFTSVVLDILNEHSLSNTYPTNWDKGFEAPYQIASGGHEVPFLKHGKWYIYIWNSEDKKNYIYSYSDDIYLDDSEEWH